MILIRVDIGQGEEESWLRVPRIAMALLFGNLRALGGIAGEPYTMLLCSSETTVREGSILMIRKKNNENP